MKLYSRPIKSTVSIAPAAAGTPFSVMDKNLPFMDKTAGFLNLYYPVNVNKQIACLREGRSKNTINRHPYKRHKGLPGLHFRRRYKWMRHFYFRFVMGIVWLLAAAVSLITLNIPSVILYLALGIVFFRSAFAFRDKENDKKR